MRPRVGAHARPFLAGDVAEVLPVANGVVAHHLGHGRHTGLRPVIVRAPEKRPPIVGDAFEIRVRVLHDEPANPLRVCERDPESNGRAEVLHVEHVAINVKHVGEAGDVLGEEIERERDLRIRVLAEAGPEIVGRHDMVAA